MACDRYQISSLVYKITITTIEISDDGGSTYTTLFSGSQEVDIAAVNAGAVAGGLISGVDLPDGTYNAIRATVGDTITVKGYVNIRGTTHYTDGGADAAAFSQAVGNDNPTQVAVIKEELETAAERKASAPMNTSAAHEVLGHHSGPA